MTLEELKVMVSSWIDINCYRSEIKYTVTFDEKTLVDLVDDAELANLFHYNEISGHVYIACKGNDNLQETIGNPQNIETIVGRPEQSSQAPSNLDNEFEHVSYENGLDHLTYEDGAGPSSILCGVQSAPTPMPELNSLKWKEKVSGIWQTFANVDAFKQALYKYSIAHNFEYTFLRNNKERMSVKCKIEGYPWKITANAMGKTTPFLHVTYLKNKHVHHAQDNLQVNHSGRAILTSSIIVEEVRSHVDKCPGEIRKTLQRDYDVNLTYKQAYAAKLKALEDILGGPEQSYVLIPWLCQRLKETDPTTIVEFVASENKTFERAFIAYGCCIDGFLVGARHVLYIDGTFLRGPYKGTLLSASAYDVDNELLPFAIAIVKGRHWRTGDGAVQAIFGCERHAFCYRHVKENFSAELMKINKGSRRTSSQSKDEALKFLDNIAYARLQNEFNDVMEDMREFSTHLFEWLMNHGDIDRWALSQFPFKRWNNITTNLAESFNAWMLNERRHNVVQLIHEHEKVAKKMYASAMAMSKWRNGVDPKTESKVRESVGKIEQMNLVDYGGNKVCVHTAYGDLEVDLGLHECSYAKWQMSGIPCAHACAAIKLTHGNVYDYVDECYKITSQEKIYSRCMTPVVTIDMPNVTDYRMENILGQTFLGPPQTSRPLGRPPIRRRESQFQNKKIYHCARCHEAGHTRRTCKNPNPC